MMRVITIAASMLLIALATASPVSAGPGVDPGVSPGLYVGTIGDGERDTYRFSTHGGNPCLGVYIPKLYVVSLSHAPADATLSLSAGGKTDMSMAGQASVTFVANYCTTFTITVDGVDVDGTAAYVVDVESAFIVGNPGS